MIIVQPQQQQCVQLELKWIDFLCALQLFLSFVISVSVEVAKVSPAVAYDEYEHSVFDEESDKDEKEEEEEDEYDEEEGFDSNEANWARKEALRKGKVLAKGASLIG